MCHHYLVAEDLPEGFVFAFSLSEDQRQAYVAYAGKLKARAAWPLQRVPALRVDPTGELEVFDPEWGLLPRWWKPSDKTPKRSTFQRRTINARSETAHEKPSFRDAMQRRRCLMPLAEFEEKKHYFGTGEPVALAGLWESWLAEDGEIETCTLLTTEPNAEVRGVGHPRMPVLLTTPESRGRWLTEGPDETLLRPLHDRALAIRPKS